MNDYQRVNFVRTGLTVVCKTARHGNSQIHCPAACARERFLSKEFREMSSVMVSGAMVLAPATHINFGQPPDRQTLKTVTSLNKESRLLHSLFLSNNSIWGR